MLLCANCSTNQLDGTIFCAVCGAALLPSPRAERTAVLDVRARADLLPRALAARAPTQLPPSVGGPALTLLLVASGRRLRVRVEDEVLIGRRDEARGILPEIDLGGEGGYDAGVSRRHAIISHRADRYQIEDLGSANGTFVNGQQVTPQAPAPLANGDELKCGMMAMRVEIT